MVPSHGGQIVPSVAISNKLQLLDGTCILNASTINYSFLNLLPFPCMRLYLFEFGTIYMQHYYYYYYRFHEVSEFDDTKRSCRLRLAGHNERRRKSAAEYHGEG